jgi:putative phage-type endonuclease
MSKVFHTTTNIDRPEWLQLRSKGIGGSDAAVILGLSKFKTPFELWLEKTGQVEPQEINNDFIHFGNVLEDVVAAEFTRRTEKKVKRQNKMFQHKEHDFMIGNIDRLVIGEKALLECKTTSAYNYKEWDSEEIPEAYIIQCQHYMAVLDLPMSYIACLIGGNRFVWKEIPRDDELIEIIIDRCRHFWEFNVLGMNAPALDGSSAAEKFLKERYTKTDPDLVKDLKHEYKDKIRHYLDLKEHYKAIEKDIKEVENQLKYELQEAETGLIDTFRVNWKPVTSNRVDTKVLKSDFPEIYNKVVKQSVSRRFDIKEVK